MENLKCPQVAIIKVRNIPFTPKERAFSLPSYHVLNSKNIIFELWRSWYKWAIYITFDLTLAQYVYIYTDVLHSQDTKLNLLSKVNIYTALTLYCLALEICDAVPKFWKLPILRDH